MRQFFTGSIMERRAVARAKPGVQHAISIEAQGAFHYVYGPYAKPKLEIEPGDVVVVETEDAFGGVIESEQDLPSAKLKFRGGVQPWRPPARFGAEHALGFERGRGSRRGKDGNPGRRRVRRGTDVLKALALGAQACMIGRPAAWGLAGAGQVGADRAIAIFAAELDSAMALLGVTRVDEVTRDCLRPAG